MEENQSPQALPQVRDNRVLFGILSMFLFVSILGVFYQTTFSMVSTWLRSETYTHGFLIIPITIWLVWQKRALISSCPLTPNYLALIPLSLAGIAWMLGYLVDVLVVQQLALVSMLIASFLVVMGWRLFKILLFPLMFLFFAVPMGEGLVPALMEYTATVTVTLVKLTGIPVYRDGMFISLPSGNWSVVEACSGVRYLIASVTLGCLFAYINYSSYKKRLIFIVVSMIVPIVANGLRAYMIVMLGHLSGMELAVGVDHLIYGWIFFGLVMLVLFSIGSIWRDPEPQGQESQDKDVLNGLGYGQNFSATRPFEYKHLVASLIVTLMTISLWPAWVYALNQLQYMDSYTEIHIPEGQKNWQAIEEKSWEWTPRITRADREINQFYSSTQNNSETIGLHLAQYLEQKQGAEVVNSENKLFNNKMSQWRVSEKRKKQVKLNDREIEVVSAVVKGPRKSLLVWYWYRVGRHHTANNYIAKLREVEARLIDGRRDASILSLSASIGSGETAEDIAVANELLQGFLTKMMAELEHSLDQSVGKAGDN